jgi:hypothetical protein
MKHERRRNIRVPGPFTAWLGDSPANRVRIMDLSEGGCFIHSPGETPVLGRPLVLHVAFPNDVTLRLSGEALYTRPGEGYVVLFSGLSQSTYAELERAVNQLRQKEK